jgi:hypothetical protein
MSLWDAEKKQKKTLSDEAASKRHLVLWSSQQSTGTADYKIK